MQIFKNKQEFFAHIHRGTAFALDPIEKNNSVTSMLFNNLYSECRAACMCGFITHREYFDLVASISEARTPEELQENTPQLLDQAL